MSEEDIKRSSHWIGWPVTVLLMPVVYVLTFPPIALPQLYDRKAGAFKNSGPEWINWYAVPAGWLYDHVPMLRKPLDVYNDWWIEMYTGKSAP